MTMGQKIQAKAIILSADEFEDAEGQGIIFQGLTSN